MRPTAIIRRIVENVVPLPFVRNSCSTVTSKQFLAFCLLEAFHVRILNLRILALKHNPVFCRKFPVVLVSVLLFLTRLDVGLYLTPPPSLEVQYLFCWGYHSLAKAVRFYGAENCIYCSECMTEFVGFCSDTRCVSAFIMSTYRHQ